MTQIIQGLYFSAIGLVVLFVTAAVLYALLIGLQALFPEKEEQEELVESIAEVVPVANTGATDDKAIAAAIAVALHCNRPSSQFQLGDGLLKSHSNWWHAHLISAHKKSNFVK